MKQLCEHLQASRALQLRLPLRWLPWLRLQRERMQLVMARLFWLAWMPCPMPTRRLYYLTAARAQLALRHGGLGLRSAERHAVAAYRASPPALSRRDPEFARALTLFLEGSAPLPHAPGSQAFTAMPLHRLRTTGGTKRQQEAGHLCVGQ